MSSGRGVIFKKDTVDDARALDILKIARAKVFEKPEYYLWTSNWERCGEVTASISYRLLRQDGEPRALRLMYTIKDRFDPEDKKELDYEVLLSSSHCHLGGRRWWYICPLVRNGFFCGRRVRILYLPHGATYFGCRECHQLTYESRQMHRNKFYETIGKYWNLMERAEKALEKARSPKSKRKAMRFYQKLNSHYDVMIAGLEGIRTQLRTGRKK